MIKVLLVDDHEIVRFGLSRIISAERGLTVIGEVSTGEKAVEFCKKNQRPDIVMMDMNMPGMGGLEATKKLLRIHEDIRVIVLTVYTETTYPTKMLQIGAHGYLTKDATPDEMIAAIRKVHSGQRYVATEIAQQVAIGQINLSQSNPFEQLSDRELQIMMMITNGEKVLAISEQLNLSSKTINTYRYRMFDKLAVTNDVELTRLAIRHNMIGTDSI